MLSRPDIMCAARDLAVTRTDAERIALGVELIGQTEDPLSWPDLRMAAELVREQADRAMLLSLQERPDRIDGVAAVARAGEVCSPPSRPAFVTLFRMFEGSPADTHASLRRVPSVPRASSLRAAWRRLADGWIGDVIGGLCLVGMAMLLVIFMGVLS